MQKLLEHDMSLTGTLVFSSGYKTDFDIWTLDLATSGLRQVTHGSDLNDSPCWSPDGKTIAFISTGMDMIASLCVVDGAGTNKRRLTSNVHCQHPDWHPDGKKILFTANASEGGEEIDVCVYDLEKDSYDVLFRREGTESQPSFSPDGRKVVFASVDTNSAAPFAHRDTEIWERDLASGEERKVCAHPARDHSPVYSPDGQSIAFVSHRNGRGEEEYLQKLKDIQNRLNVKDRKSIDQAITELQSIEWDSEICVVDANGGNMRQLTHNDGMDVGVRWSPCGKYLVYSSADKDSTSTERIRIIEVESGKVVPLKYDRDYLMAEIGSDPNALLNQRWVSKVLPDFIERPIAMWILGGGFFGEERQPDWTAKTY
jgi:Tol biopolymer transport system component